jgi:Tfp pilus assembly protein PilF
MTRRPSLRRIARRTLRRAVLAAGLAAAAMLIIVDTRACGAEGAGAAPETTPAAKAESAEQELDARIQSLIQQLGAAQYATRERAQAELRRLGLTAFDALYEAQKHDDIEISLRAQYLVRSLTVDWAHEDDPIEVKGILRNYGEKDIKQRRSLMDELRKLPDGAGVPALARLARFERSPELSKRAALLIMTQPLSELDERSEPLARRIDKTMELSKRPAAQWLRIFARTLREPGKSLEEWERIVAEEERALAEFPETTSRQLVLDLLRWHSEFLSQLGRKSEAEDAMRRAVSLVQGAREEIIETVDWLMANEAWGLVDELAARFGGMFEKDSLLMYRLAEAQLKRGQKDQAEQTALRAFQSQDDSITERVVLAHSLYQSRGLIEWAEREYRHILDQEPLVSITALNARQRLAEMLHDHLRDREAAEVYQPLVDALDKDPNLERSLEQANIEAGGLRSRMHFFYAEHHRQQGDHARQRERLSKALQHDPREADALIAMFHAPGGDEKSRAEDRRMVEEAAQQFRRGNTTAASAARACRRERRHPRVRSRYLLAMYNNQYAWLVSNTFGDFQEALRLSHESLKLRPNTGAYLDTLAHCYAAVGDLENAVKYQSLAVELEPHSGQIVRKLAEFEQEWEASKKKSSP